FSHVVTVFFFQAEDGIRDPLVTGVQTCALPISPPPWRMLLVVISLAANTNSAARLPSSPAPRARLDRTRRRGDNDSASNVTASKIGRASCREGVEVVARRVALNRERSCKKLESW